MAEEPSTIWNQRGMNTTAAKNPNAMKNMAATLARKAGIRNMWSGTIGSLARDSAQRNTARHEAQRDEAADVRVGPLPELLVREAEQDRHQRGDEDAAPR